MTILVRSAARPVARPVVSTAAYTAQLSRNQAAAAAANADTQSPLPFYWEIGDANGTIVSGVVGDGSVTATTSMNVASASKLLYHAFAAQSITLTGTDVPYLRMTSGYIGMTGQCASGDTVDSCLANTGWGTVTSGQIGNFWYNGAHMEKHCSVRLGLGSDRVVALHTAYEAALGVSTIQFTTPTVASGAYMTPATYAAFLRKLLNGDYALSALMGTQQTPASALLGFTHSPAPVDEAWYYGLGCWVEPDGTFSSGGSLGFYPWINSAKTLYGIVARNGLSGSESGSIGIESVRTGQAIRRAYLG